MFSYWCHLGPSSSDLKSWRWDLRLFVIAASLLSYMGLVDREKVVFWNVVRAACDQLRQPVLSLSISWWASGT